MKKQEKEPADIPQQSILRVLQLIRLLANPPEKSIDQLAKWIGVNKRTIYRYFNLLKEIGYIIHKDNTTYRYQLVETQNRTSVKFSIEESQLMRQLLAALPEKHPLTESIRRKIYLTSELIPIADELIDIHRAHIVQQLAEAIASKKQVRLVQYHSTNSDPITDRLIEPIFFADNYAQLEAYELNSQKIKTFKIQRIEQVEILAQDTTYTSTEIIKKDAFGFSGDTFTVVLHLSNRAYRLLIEEYPLLRPYVQAQSNTKYPYRFVGEVCNEKGIGRFILGIPSEVLVESPQPLKDYLNSRIAGVKW